MVALIKFLKYHSNGIAFWVLLYFITKNLKEDS